MFVNSQIIFTFLVALIVESKAAATTPWVRWPSVTTTLATTVTPSPTTTPSTDIPATDSTLQFLAVWDQRQKEYRVKHKAAPLTLDYNLVSLAAGCVDQYAAIDSGSVPTTICQRGEYGGWLAGSDPVLVAVAALDQWYTTEKSLYSFATPGYKEETKHFSQIIWKATTSYGCAVGFNEAKTNAYFSCIYIQPGNTPTDFAENVLPPIAQKTEDEEDETS